ncbi:HD domain-containing phosphohydrolase [Varunaivibrio sulfuroxidans]|uniref:Response regulator RpfG family c-di-GMP phosphodiesterase n=1 Tax=Varunaivibrio sulfuroxidans TaxID=1773489 RepID=A0A4R3J9N3_9PROT|nr:HD domain-containing phosphohydrolase [Varunaivibrio sulfuroxidans]TCS62227.1 response regulator RpfG family c-di-GMP phosphodiesterase [Varunaivibrio sulfuroxidans]WES30652.1 response regulator [Varunaivibrio sulfuroxidans]
MPEQDVVLLVDDEENVLSALRRQMRGMPFALVTANSALQALELAHQGGKFSVIIADMNMPAMNGIQLLEVFQKHFPDTVRIMLTGNADQKTAMDAINQGSVFRFFTKPCEREQLQKGIDDAIKQYRLVISERVLTEQTLAGSIKVLSDVMSMMNPKVFGRGIKIRGWTQKVTKTMGIPNPWQLELAAMLAQIGVVALPQEVLKKSGTSEALSPMEQDMVAKVPETGKKLLQNIPRMQEVAQTVYYQNKCFDGTGFPHDKISGKEIPLGARLLKIFHDIDAIQPDPEPSPAAIAALENRTGLYDPRLLKVVKSIFLSKEDRSKTAQQKVLELNVPQLRSGLTLLSDIKLQQGHLILAKGTKLTDTQIERLRNIAQIRKFNLPILAVQETA